MKSFQFPTVGKRPSASSKKDLEEQKKKLEEQAAAEAFEEYVAVFQETASSKPSSKVWIKAGTYEAGKKHEDLKTKTLYKPVSRFEKDGQPSGTGGGGGGSGVGGAAIPPPSSSSSSSLVDYDDGSKRPDKPGKKKQTEKKKSNLEIFKEELKIIQEEREERHRLKRMLGLQEVIKLPPKPGDDLRASLSLELDDVRMGSIDDGDPNTTNIYLGNLPTKISEQQLMEVFGKYGPLASVKVMWPRTDEEKARNRLSGFVAFMSRRDGERALKHLTGKEILGSEIKLGWGKAVPIPAYPVYIPPAMLEMTMPPPLSGLPFNAQVDRRDKHKIPPLGTPYPTDPKGKEEFEKILVNATVKVVMPTDRALLALIHRMVEFVIREGPMFEAMIMNKEISNPQFRFLFENQSPAHVYYRWKLYSILQGDSTQKWRIEEFRMFRGGSVWRPPKLNPFTQGMPDELIPEEEREIRIGSLSNAQRTRLERMLRRISPERHKVAEVMIFSIEHSESTEEICLCVKESLCNRSTSLQKKIARLYVVNDVLHNCTAKGMNAFGYRKAFKTHLPAIFQELHYAYSSAGGGAKEGEEDRGGTVTESFKQRVMGCFKAWDEWGVYSNEFLIRLQNIFLGLATFDEREELLNQPDMLLNLSPSTAAEQQRNNNDESSDEETARTNLNVHRQKLHKRSAPPRAQLPPSSAMKLVKSLQSAADPEINEDLDGVPLDEEDYEDPTQPQTNSTEKPKFIPSKWEELDPEQVKAQAVTTTSKWDLFEDGKEKEHTEPHEQASSGQQQQQQQQDGGKSLLVDYGDEDEDIDGEPMEEDDYDNNEEEEEDQDERSKVSGNALIGEEDRRKIMREIELKVLAFQDELEKRGVVGGSVDVVREYREKLIRKLNNSGNSGEDRFDRKRSRRRSSSYDDDNGSPRPSSQSHQHHHHRSSSSSTRHSHAPTTTTSTHRSRSPFSSSSSSKSRSYHERTRSTSSNDSRSRRSRSPRSPGDNSGGDDNGSSRKHHSSSSRSHRRRRSNSSRRRGGGGGDHGGGGSSSNNNSRSNKNSRRDSSSER